MGDEKQLPLFAPNSTEIKEVIDASVELLKATSFGVYPWIEGAARKRMDAALKAIGIDIKGDKK